MNPLFDRGLRFAGGLAIAVAIPVAILFHLQFRSLSELETASTVVLQQLSSETADRLEQGLRQDLRAPFYILQRVSHSELETLNLPAIERVLGDTLPAYRFVDGFFMWSQSAPPDRAGKVYVIDRGQPATAKDRASPVRADPALEALLREQAAALARHKRGFGLSKVTLDGRHNHLAYRLLFDTVARDRLISFAGFRVDFDRFRHEYLPAVMRERLQAAAVPGGFPPLVVTLMDESGAAVYQSAPADPSRFVDERVFPLVFFDPDLLEALRPYEPHVEEWRLRTGYGSRTVADIVGARTMAQRGLMAALALVMAGGLFFIAHAAAREVRLAELKSSFVASVSHDLKTPLALIQLFAETLELGRMKSAERAQEYYRIINSEARKLNRLIDNLLDFSKIEAGLRPYRPDAIDLGEITGRVLAALRSQVEHGGFHVTSEVEDDLPLVMADPEAVEQALENLLSNAMKYSGGRREIAVRVGRRDGFGCVSIADQGIGIPRRLQRKIFRKFYRIETDSGTGPQGCGLGLAIVDHIVRAHRGFVDVESDPGRGATFTIGFPIVAQEEADEAYPRDRGRAADAARPA